MALTNRQLLLLWYATVSREQLIDGMESLLSLLSPAERQAAVSRAKSEILAVKQGQIDASNEREAAVQAEIDEIQAS